MDLAAVAARLAQDASEIQRELDHKTQAQRQAFAQLLSSLPPALSPLLAPLAPPQLVVTRHQVHCRLEHCIRRSAPWSVRFVPASHGASALQPVSASKTVTIDITVERVPLVYQKPL
jgi:hypothetical protein